MTGLARRRRTSLMKVFRKILKRQALRFVPGVN